MDLQNPSCEIMRENATEDSDDKLETLHTQHPILKKNKSLAFPVQINFENPKYTTPKKNDNIKPQYYIKDSLTYPEKKKILHHQYKSQNQASSLLMPHKNYDSQQKNHNFSYFIQSEQKSSLFPKKSESSEENTRMKSYSKADILKNKELSLKKDFSISNSMRNSYWDSPPDITEFYKDITFPESLNNKGFQKPCRIGKVNLVYRLQHKINSHSKLSLDKRFNLVKNSECLNKIEENFESDELSEGKSEEISGF